MASTLVAFTMQLPSESSETSHEGTAQKVTFVFRRPDRDAVHDLPEPALQMGCLTGLAD